MAQSLVQQLIHVSVSNIVKCRFMHPQRSCGITYTHFIKRNQLGDISSHVQAKELIFASEKFTPRTWHCKWIARITTNLSVTLPQQKHASPRWQLSLPSRCKLKANKDTINAF